MPPPSERELTMPTKKPVNCRCGRKAYLSGEDRGFFVVCRRPNCWIGPMRKTVAEAIAAWNRGTPKGK